MVNVPLATVELSSVTEPVEVPLIVGTSFTPVIVTVICWVSVPSAEATVKVSVVVEPAANACTPELVLSNVYVQAPAELTENVP